MHDFSTTQILREINFGDSRSAKSAIVTHFNGSESKFFDEFLHFWRLEFTILTKFRAPNVAKNGSFITSTFSKIKF